MLDHKPVFITIESNVIPIDSPQPRWNYKKAEWSLFSIRANELTKDIRVQGRNENIVVKEWTQGILKAAREAIPRGARKDYKPFWSDDLKVLEDELNEAREKAEKEATEASTIGLQQAKAKFLKQSWKQKGNHGERRQAPSIWRKMARLSGNLPRI